MAPAFIVDETPDFHVAAPISLSKASSGPRILLLAPPSVSSHPELLERTVAAHDRDHTDIQMLDRLAAGLVSLPPETYDIVLLLTDADGGRIQSRQILNRSVMSKIVGALKVGGKLKSQDGLLSTSDTPERTEAILAGLVTDHADDGGLMKPETSGAQSVPLRFGKKTDAGGGQAINGVNSTAAVTGKRKSIEPERPAGVGFVDFGDDLDIPIITGEDDELIDEDELLTEEDLTRQIVLPPECRPKTGKRRRACKNCTCSLKEKLEEEDRKKRENADRALNTLKLNPDELAEVDFTVQGKVGSCGNCALGDAFRCDGCPYIGLPAFKPGEEVRLLNNDVQL